jgi:phosphoribosylanthranilate isomerase
LTSILSKYPRRLGEPAWLIDAYQAGVYGGTGIRVDVDSFKMSLSSLGPFLLAGGLTPENVARVVEQVRPWGVDVASGVETAPGEKSFDKMRAFVRAAHGSAEEEFYNAASN